MGFTFDIEGTEYVVEPYKVTFDWQPQFVHEHNNEQYGTNVDRSGATFMGANYTNLTAIGNTLDLREAFRETFNGLRAAGVYVNTDSLNRHTMCTVKVAYQGGAETTFDYQYGYLYDPATPAKLTVYVHGASFDPDNIAYGTNYGQYTIVVDYNSQPAINEKLTVIINRIINKFDAYDNTDTIILGAMTGVCKPVRSTVWGWTTTGLTMSYTLAFQAATLDQFDAIPEGLLHPLPVPQTLYYGNAPCYMYPYANPGVDIGDLVTPDWIPPSGGTNNMRGAVYLNTQYAVTINGVDFDPDAPSDSQDDNTSSHDFNRKTFYDSSDYIPDDGLPFNDALDTGFIHAYNMTPTNAKLLADYMLTDNFIQGVKHLMADPINYIVSFVMLPVEPTITGSASILIGGVDTQISGALISEQFKRFSCGTIKCSELWNGFPDYSPSTKVAIFLPFVGIRSLNVDDVMSGNLEVVYRIDVLTGEFICTITSDTSRALNGIIAAFNGTMGMDIPITAVNYQNKLNALTSAVSGGVSLAAGVASGNALSAIGGAAQGATGMAQAILSKPTIERSSSLSGSSGVLGNFTPYLIIDRPVQALPKNYSALNGYSSEIGGTLSDFSGYIEVESIDLSGVACTDAERSEILAMMKGGVFV